MSVPQEQMQQPEQPDYDKMPLTYADEDEEFLFGPTSRPAEAVTQGVQRARAKTPKELYRYAPALLKLAESPDAPPELLQFVRVMQYHLEGR